MANYVIEQLDEMETLQCSWVYAHLDSHQFVGTVHVEQFPTAVRPQRLRPPSRGHLLQERGRIGEGSHVDLISARAVGDIGQPAPVG